HAAPELQRLYAAIGKAQTIDERVGFMDTMKARARIPQLRLEGDGSDFEMSKSQTTQTFDRDSVFIVPGGKADRIFEFQSKGLDLQAWIIYFKDGSKPRG